MIKYRRWENVIRVIGMCVRVYVDIRVYAFVELLGYDFMAI